MTLGDAPEPHAHINDRMLAVSGPIRLKDLTAR